MTVSVNGIIIEQFYGDNSGSIEVDTNGDGVATQEDEFVSVQNSSGSTVDISGMQIWTDAGVGGLFHTFPSGSVLVAGRKLYVMNDISGVHKYNMQRASRPTGAGLAAGLVALVDPQSGAYLEFRMAAGAQAVRFAGFSGTRKVGEVNAVAQSGKEALEAGYSYRYNPDTDSYEHARVSVNCFAAGARICTPKGMRAVEDLRLRDLVWTRDRGAQPVGMILKRRVVFDRDGMARHRPIEFAPGSLSGAQPERALVLSPQHRVLWRDAGGEERLVPAKAFVGRAGVRVQAGRREVVYYQVVLARHDVILADGAWVESFYPGEQSLKALHPLTRQCVLELFDPVGAGLEVLPARQLVSVGAARREMGLGRGALVLSS